MRRRWWCGDTQLDAAATALAVILLYEAEAAKGPVRPLHLVSFSADLDASGWRCNHKRHFPYLRHGAADTLVRRMCGNPATVWD